MRLGFVDHENAKSHMKATKPQFHTLTNLFLFHTTLLHPTLPYPITLNILIFSCHFVFMIGSCSTRIVKGLRRCTLEKYWLCKWIGQGQSIRSGCLCFTIGSHGWAVTIFLDGVSKDNITILIASMKDMSTLIFMSVS